MTDNCGLDPSDMDDKTKAQCRLLPIDAATEPESPACTGNNVLVPESPIGPYCDYGGGDTEYEQYQQDTGYPYSEDEYDSLYGYQQCGTACGKEPTSGETQHEWGCQQGYITEGC